MNQKHTMGGRLALLAAALIWGTSFIVMKDAVSGVPVFQLLAIRFTVAFVLLGLVFLRRLLRCGRETVLHGVICGVLLLGAYSVQTFGLTDTTPGKNAFLTAVYCVLVPFGTWLLFRRRPTAYNWIAAVLCIIGIGLVSLNGEMTVSRGDALTLLGGVIFAAHVIALSHYTAKSDAISLTIVQFGTCAALACLLSLLTEGVLPLPAAALPQLLYLAVFATAAALLLQSVGQSRTPPSQSAILLSLESVFGVAFSVALGAEALTLQLFCGFALIFVSVIVSETQLSFLRRKN